MEYTFISAFAMLFLIVDPIGNIPSFIAVMKNVKTERIPFVIVRECIFAIIILSIFALGGRAFLNLLGLTQPALTIGGAIVLLIISLRMMFPIKGGIYGDTGDEEPLIFPLAVPMLAGPSALATVMILANGPGVSVVTWMGAITATMASSALILICSGRIQRICGPRVTSAFERLMGLILVVISVQMFLSGIGQAVVDFGLK